MVSLAEYFADCLSVITIVACLVLKVPQILNIHQKKTSKGINLNALLLELVSYTVTCMYNYKNGYSLLTYLEYPIILVQQMVLILLVLKYSNQLTTSSTRFTMLWYWLAVLAFLTNALPSSILSYFVPLCTPVSGASKCMYIYSMIQEQNSETTSLLTWVISIATNLFRIFTVYMDSADSNLLFNFVISTLLSSAVLCTALYYRKYPLTQSTIQHHED